LIGCVGAFSLLFLYFTVIIAGWPATMAVCALSAATYCVCKCLGAEERAGHLAAGVFVIGLLLAGGVALDNERKQRSAEIKTLVTSGAPVRYWGNKMPKGTLLSVISPSDPDAKVVRDWGSLLDKGMQLPVRLPDGRSSLIEVMALDPYEPQTYHITEVEPGAPEEVALYPRTDAENYYERASNRMPRVGHAGLGNDALRATLLSIDAASNTAEVRIGKLGRCVVRLDVIRGIPPNSPAVLRFGPKYSLLMFAVIFFSGLILGWIETFVFDYWGARANRSKPERPPRPAGKPWSPEYARYLMWWFENWRS
jgi:hypothetical protein